MAVSMKQKIKEMLAAIVYFFYEKGILHNSIQVYSIDETLDELLRTNKSMVRFGDGEIMMIKGKDLKLQQGSSEIAEGLAGILRYQHENLLVTIPGVFAGLSGHRKESVQFWKDHLLFYRKTYETYCNKDRIYGTTFVSRCYYFAEDKSNCGKWFAKIKKLWENKDIVVVEGARTHNGVGNDLFASAGSIERIICPPKNAYASLSEIMAACEQYSTDRLFLLSVGATAKFIACDLFRKGYRVLDIGNLDIEYEWFIRHAEKKIPIEKHEVVGEEADRAAGFDEYLKQIRCRI